MRFTMIALSVLCLTLVPARADDAPARLAAAEIERVLAQMTEAVLAADADTYLRHVWAGDDFWRTEQRNWAADLAEHTPARFEAGIDADGLELGDNTATAPFTVRWAMPPELVEREVAFTARFVRDDGGWLYAGKDWLRTEGEGVTVLYASGYAGPADAAARVYPEIRAHVEDGFGVEIRTRQHVKIYGSMEHLQFSIYLSYTDPLGGWNEPGESIKLLGDAARSEAVLTQVLAHELAHVATFKYGPEARTMPWWALEGVAELASERFSPGLRSQTDMMVARWARGDLLAPWDEIDDFRTTDQVWMMHAYRQGHHMLGYISEHWGREERNTWLREMAQGATLDEATRRALGISFEALDERWRRSLAAKEPEQAPDG